MVVTETVRLVGCLGEVEGNGDQSQFDRLSRLTNTMKSAGLSVTGYFKAGHGCIRVKSKCFGKYGERLNVGDSASNGFAKVEVVSVQRYTAVLRFTSSKTISFQ